MNLSDRIARKSRKPCEACGSPDPHPATHKTWCSIRLESSQRPVKDLTSLVLV